MDRERDRATGCITRIPWTPCREQRLAAEVERTRKRGREQGAPLVTGSASEIFLMTRDGDRFNRQNHQDYDNGI